MYEGKAAGIGCNLLRKRKRYVITEILNSILDRKFVKNERRTSINSSFQESIGRTV